MKLAHSLREIWDPWVCVWSRRDGWISVIRCHAWIWLLIAILGFFVWDGTGKAQSVRESVKEHLENGLKKAKQKNRIKSAQDSNAPKKTAPKKTRVETKSKTKSTPKHFSNHKRITINRSQKRKSGDGAHPASTSENPSERSASRLPLRVFGKGFKIDIEPSIGYRGWLPQQYPWVKVSMTSYLTWAVSLRAKMFRWLNLHHAYYESNGISGPRTEEAAVAAEIGSYVPKAAWLLGMLGFPIFKAWEPIIRYETRAFQTSARPNANQGVCIVERRTSSDLENCDRVTESLRIVSGFETFIAGVRYTHSKDSSAVIHKPKGEIPPIFFGIGLMSYSKPYQVTIQGYTLDEFLFDSRFRGAGLALGTDVGGGPDRLFLDVDCQLGIGQVELTRDLTLNELAPEDWMIGYLQGNIRIGYRLPLTRVVPTLMFVPIFTGGGATFFFFETEIKAGEAGTTPTVNWDFLWSIRGSLILSL